MLCLSPALRSRDVFRIQESKFINVPKEPGHEHDASINFEHLGMRWSCALGFASLWLESSTRGGSLTSCHLASYKLFVRTLALGQAWNMPIA